MEQISALLVQIAALVITGMLTAALAALRAYLKSKLTTEQYDLLDKLANSAVWSVEQQGPGLFLTKKEAATNIVNQALAHKGIELPEDAVNAAIESNVATSFHYGKLAGDPFGTTGATE